ncbi:hypothetical protein D0U02_20460 [Burkholderia pseudomallei]|nr:hypothetical protein BOC35_03530 [Burkholderia pseudomallei]PNW94286.1 hypothetical protein CF649_33660 [Burkholderia sp. 136(2017)]PNX10722.1 hypothetical protein CF650_34285 [Burkholderia sp. 129]PNX24248.1 hypothetical protein CF647_33675 [Burkholderia sp. 117]PNX31019.1 hypothetical protein CF648_33665 [Burkholderia sp. 137]
MSDGAAVAVPSCRSPTISPWRSVVGVSVVELEEAWSRYRVDGVSYRFPQRLEAMRSSVALAARRSNSSESKPGPTQFR